MISNYLNANTGAAVKRAELIRAMIAAIEESELDLSTAISEEDARTAILNAIS